jgi:hypothetical protein
LQKLFDLSLPVLLGRDRPGDRGSLLALLKRALKGEMSGLIDFGIRVLESIDPNIGGVLDMVRQAVVSTDKFPLEALRGFFKATVYMTQGNFEHAFVQLQYILRNPTVLKSIGVQREVIDGLFNMVHGVVEKDPGQLIKGMPAVKR